MRKIIERLRSFNASHTMCWKLMEPMDAGVLEDAWLSAVQEMAMQRICYDAVPTRCAQAITKTVVDSLDEIP